MSGTGEASTEFAGEMRDFRIRLGEIRRIQIKCGASIGVVCQRLARATLVIQRLGGNMVEALSAGVDIYADDVRETLYQGLIGRGMASAEATKLIALEIDDRGLRGLLDNASAALFVLVGSQDIPEGDDPPGEPRAGEGATPPNPSTSPTSTAPASSSA